MRFVKGRLTKTSDNEWVFITRVTTKDRGFELSGVRNYPITSLDEEVVRFHEQELRLSHNMEYVGEDMNAELKECWSTPEGTYSDLYPSEKFLPLATKKTFAKLIYQEDESKHQEAAS